jgi:N-acyl-D-amino-acid deacylase
MWDLLIQRARVIDGSGTPSFVADVAIRGDTIAQVGAITSPQARVIIDGTG